MRIALVSQEYPPETASGGIGTQAYQKAHWLADRGHEVYVISHSVDGIRREYEQGNVLVIRISGFDEALPIVTEEVRWLTYSMQVAAELSHLHATHGLDLAEFPDWGSEAYIHLLNRSASNRFPVVVHLHGPIVMFAHAIGWPDPNSEFYRVARSMEETCLRLADAVFSSSRCSADWCVRHYKLSPASVPILHTGVDTSHFQPATVQKNARPTIVYVGRIERNKGADVLVDAGIRLAQNDPDLQIRLLGRGNPSLIAELREKASSAGFPNMLELPGFVSRQDLPGHLSRAHAFALPSEYEGGPGIVYLEAMACGLPVVACSGSGAAEVVQDGMNGLRRSEDARTDSSSLTFPGQSRATSSCRAVGCSRRPLRSGECLRSRATLMSAISSDRCRSGSISMRRMK
jgi:glycosyltransferase involved in cell wall biosynthesis